MITHPKRSGPCDVQGSDRFFEFGCRCGAKCGSQLFFHSARRRSPDGHHCIRERSFFTLPLNKKATRDPLFAGSGALSSSLAKQRKSKSPIQSLVLANLEKNGIHGFAHNFICSPPDAEELCVVNNCFDIYLTFLIIEYCKQIYYYKCNGKKQRDRSHVFLASKGWCCNIA